MVFGASKASRKVDFARARAALCEPRSADFGAVSALNSKGRFCGKHSRFRNAK